MGVDELKGYLEEIKDSRRNTRHYVRTCTRVEIPNLMAEYKIQTPNG